MAIRTFVDADGVHWTVWSTTPFTTGVASALQRGWLTFEAGELRRRLAPVPPAWEEATVAQLCRYCSQASPVARSQNSGVWPATPRDP